MKTVFFRVLDADDKAAALRAAIREPAAALGKQRFQVDAANFAAVPRSPFAYWVSEKILATFPSSEPAPQGRLVVSTNPLNADFRYVRTWWEASAYDLGGTWRPWAKGGAYSTVYYDIDTVIRWDVDRSTYAGFLGTENRPLERPASVQHFFRPGLTWPRRTQGGLSLRAMPAGCIFADKGPAIFVNGDDRHELLALLAIVNATAFRALVDLQMAFGSYEVGVIQRTPIPDLKPGERSTLAMLARRIWSLKHRLDTRTETSHACTLPGVLQVEGDTLTARATAWAENVRTIDGELSTLQVEIDNRCFVLYGIDEADRRAITEGFGPTIAASDEAAEADEDAEDACVETPDEGETERSADVAVLGAELVSWTVGVAVGRFDVRLATGERGLLVEPQPFDALPICSPAMLTGADGLPAATAPSGYPCAFPENGILVDDPGHPRDITAAVRAVFDTVFGTRGDAWWNEVAALLGPKDHDLRAWIGSSFFEHHLKRYSKSRRKAPILWQLATPSRRYSVWLYVHRLTRDSFFQLQNDVMAPKVAHEERQLTELVQSAGGSPSAKQRKEIATHAAFVEELRALLDEVKRVTPLWNPTFDDGVVLTMAPLWRLVPQHKPWQRELKDKWDELTGAAYDWAQIAMHLWPERVVPKCAIDRSLAIAHGLEDVFWTEGADGKWKSRPTPKRPVEELVRERTSPAVKSAVKSLLEAPVTTRAGARGRRRRAAFVAAD